MPLILAVPGQKAGRESAPVSLVDIFPTLLDIAGIPRADIRTPIDGRSLLPALARELPVVPIFAEHIDGGTEAPRVCIRDGTSKLVISRAYPTQFFDLGDDPFEQNDLSGQGHSEEARLLELARETWDLDTLAADVVASQTARQIVDGALSQGRQEVWDFTPRPDVHQSYVRRGDAFPEVERRGYLPYKG